MNTKGHLPLRMCIGCGNRKKKEEMIRFVRGTSGMVSLNKKNVHGRGFYLCPDLECFKALQKKMRRVRFLEPGDLDVLSSQIPSGTKE